jgi:hypothetical protein
MTSERARSEQQQNLELAAEPPEDDPRPWLRTDPDVARETDGFPAGRQIVPPDTGRPVDDEPTEIAEDAGTGSTVGAEQVAMHVETGDEGSGRDG